MDAMVKFTGITGKHASDCNLLRVPSKGMPWQITMRVFVSDCLSKISKRMWGQAPDKDILLLRKLKESKYDTEKDRIPNNDLANVRNQVYKNKQKLLLDSRNYSNRNQATDWNIVKGARTGKRS
jgi:hypothetical protein